MLGPWLGSSFVGCGGTGDELAPSPAEVVDGAGVVGFEVLGGAGEAPWRVQVRTLNVFGASVESDDVVVTVDGTDRPIAFDALGYGGVTVVDPGTHTVVVDGNEPVTAHVFEAAWPGIGGSTAFLPPVLDIDEVFGVTDGLAARAGAELWFVGDDTPAHRVLRADAELLGARAVQVDVDGRTDLVAWTASQLFVLRGHTGGGFGWGTAFRASGLTVASVDVGDLSGDNLPDIAIAWVKPDGSGVLDVWEAIGVFRFQGAEPRNIPGTPRSLAVSDANGDGVAQVTVLHDDGSWSRYLRGAELQYIPVGPSLPTTLFAQPGSTLLACGDANGDDADEVVIASPYDAETDRSFSFVDIDTEALECAAGDPGAQCLTEYVLLDGLVGGEAACGDTNVDTVDELWAWDRAEGLRLYQHDPLTGDFRSEAIDHPFADGRFALSDRNLDGIADPVFADGAAWSQYVGAPPSVAEGLWSIRPELTWRVRDDVFGPFALTDTDADPDTFEWVTTTSNASGTYLRLVQYLPLADGSPLLGDVRLDDVGEVIDDLAVCGTNVFVALGGAVTRVTLADPLDPQVAVTGGADIVRVACGVGPAGSTLVTVTSAGAAELRNNNLTKLQDVQGTFGDAILADLGAGPEVVGCASPGCGVAVWNHGGGTAVVTGDGSGLTLAPVGAIERPLGGSGAPFVADVDGDGREDLAAWDRARRRLTIVRSTGGEVAPPTLIDLEADYRHVAFGDGDGDGAPDLFATDELDELVHTLLVLPPPEPTPTGTGT
jgi:hypothetical protein